MNANNTPPAEELLKKIRELEAGHAHLKEELSKLKDSKSDVTHQRSHSLSPRRLRLGAAPRRKEPTTLWKNSASFRHSSPLQRESRSGESGGAGGGSSGGDGGPASVNFTDRQYLNILQSMGQSVYIFDLDGRIIYW